MKNIQDGMILYHGSYCIVENPDLGKCSKYKDFGKGFYLTTSKQQAKNFAKIVSTRAKFKTLIPYSQNFGYVSYFKVVDVNKLQIFSFETADVNWLHCIVAHRSNSYFREEKELMKNYDVISGKIANDDTNTTILAYMGNVYGTVGTKNADDFCINLLLPDRLKDQYCFRTTKALSALQFLKSEKVPLE